MADEQKTPLPADELLERLASIEHDQWVSWAKSLMDSETLSPHRCERWSSLFCPYSDLSEEMKDHDRKWASQVLAAIDRAPAPQPSGDELRQCGLTVYEGRIAERALFDGLGRLVGFRVDGADFEKSAELAKLRAENERLASQRDALFHEVEAMRSKVPPCIDCDRLRAERDALLEIIGDVALPQRAGRGVAALYIEMVYDEKTRVALHAVLDVALAAKEATDGN